MFFPLVVDDIEQHAFLKLFHYLFAVRLGSGFEVDGDVIYFLAVRDRNQNILVHLPLRLIDILDLRIGNLHQFVHTAFETLQGSLCYLLAQFIALAAGELLFAERQFDGESLHHVVLQTLIIARLTGFVQDAFSRLVDHVRDIYADAFTHQGVAAFGVNQVTLLVHHVVVFDQAFTNAEVVLFHFLLRPFDGVGDHVVLDHLAFLESHPVHDGSNTLGTEHTHQVVLQRYVEHGATRVTLTSSTTAELSVHTAALMPLRTDDGQTAGFFHLRRQLDIRSTTCHVGCYRYHAGSTRLGYHLRLLLVQFRVQNIMLDLADVKHLAQQLGYLDAGCTYQHRTALVHHVHDLVNHGVVFLAFGAVDTVVHVVSRDRFVGRDNDNIQFVDVPELACLRLGGTGHTGELVVHTEIVLKGDGCECLGRAFHFHVLFGFYRLVQSVGPAAAFHDTAGLFVHNLHLAAVDDIIHIFLKQRVGFQQLVNGMHAFALDAVVGQDIVFLLLSLFLRTSSFVTLYFYFRHLASYIRQDEEIRIVCRSCQRVDAFVRQLDGLVLLVNHEIQLVRGYMHVLLVLLQIELFGLLETHFDTRLGEELDQRFALRHSFERTEESQLAGFAFFLVGGTHLRFRLS